MQPLVPSNNSHMSILGSRLPVRLFHIEFRFSAGGILNQVEIKVLSQTTAKHPP